MKLLDIYLIKKFLLNLLFGEVAIIVIFLVIDLVENIDKLKGIWERVLSIRESARLLDVKIDFEGVLCSAIG